MLKPQILLASQSPRRIMLLERAGYDCEVMPSNAEEAEAQAHDIDAIVVANARAKGEEVFSRLLSADRRFRQPTALVAADTLVVMGDKVYPKPKDLAEAETFIQELGGREHRVLTGVYLRRLDRERERSFFDVTRVVLAVMSVAEIRDLFARVTPLDKAAAYGFQDAPEIVTALHGSETNVMGLPMERFEGELAALFSAADTSARQSLPAPPA